MATPASALGSQKLTPTQQFSVDLREFLDSFDKLAVGGGAGAGLALLGRGFEKEFADTPDGQAEGQIEIGTMFLTLVTGTGSPKGSEPPGRSGHRARCARAF